MFERDEHLDRLIEHADLDELVREIDRRCNRRDWTGLLALRDLCRAAVERGKQLWPAASLAEYRLALDAPARLAAGVIIEGAGRFSLGPLAEVAASTHTWTELAPHLPGGPLAAVVAHERVVRGDDLHGDGRLPAGVFEPLPPALEPWEAPFPVATYEADAAHFPMPPLPPPEPAELPPPALEHTPDADEPLALVQLAHGWTAGSNGRAAAVGIAGTAAQAVATLTGRRQARMAQISAGEAVVLMAWTAASGGAHGRRRGMAAGRFDAWWAAATLAGLGEQWGAAELGDAVGELRWFVWDIAEPDTGWWFRLAVDDPADEMAWAVAAADAT